MIVGSHLTGLTDTIMEQTGASQIEHVVYLVVGYQFFVLVIGDEPIKWRLSTPVRWVLLAVAMAVDTFTGITLMLATEPIAMGTATRPSGRSARRHPNRRRDHVVLGRRDHGSDHGRPRH